MSAPFIVAELPKDNRGRNLRPQPKSAWRILAETNPGKWVFVGARPTPSTVINHKMTHLGFTISRRFIDDAADYGFPGPHYCHFVKYEGRAK